MNWVKISTNQIKAMNRGVIAFNMIESLGMVERDDGRAVNKD